MIGLIIVNGVARIINPIAALLSTAVASISYDSFSLIDFSIDWLIDELWPLITFSTLIVLQIKKAYLINLLRRRHLKGVFYNSVIGN